MKKWPNLVKGTIIQEPDQFWVSDITYIKSEKGHCYLNMITDAYSRKIVGYAVDENMETESMIKALRMATNQKLKRTFKPYTIGTEAFNIAVKSMLD